MHRLVFHYYMWISLWLLGTDVCHIMLQWINKHEFCTILSWWKFRSPMCAFLSTKLIQPIKQSWLFRLTQNGCFPGKTRLSVTTQSRYDWDHYTHKRKLWIKLEKDCMLPWICWWWCIWMKKNGWCCCY